jgi:hypothetical protein
MKRIVVLLMLAVAIPTGTALSQPNGFDSQLSALRKDIIAVCGRLQAGKPDGGPAQLAAAIDTIVAGWNVLKGSYRDNPPEVYANDPAWKGYFVEADDNFSLMRTKAAEGNYKRAVQFCGLNCALFVKIHQVNGAESVTDRLFSLRQAVKTVQAMVAAGNRRGAKLLLKRHRTDFDNMPGVKIYGIEGTEIRSDINLLKEGFIALIKTLDEENREVVNDVFVKYLTKFNGIYVKYI